MSAERVNPVLQPNQFKLSGDRAFYTLQGEGVSTGEPAVFLRLHFCNLQCSWCDTPYTWNRKMEAFYTEPQDLSVEDTAAKVKELWGCENPDKQKRVIVTGGEPLIQKDRIDQLLDLLPDWKMEVETNGTIMPTEKQLERCQFNCSPKLDNSGNPAVARIRGEVIKKLATVDSSFKFVVAKPEDLDEIERDFVQPFGIPVDKVILMPLGINSADLQAHSQAVAEHAKKKGYRLLGRLQINVWGNKRQT